MTCVLSPKLCLKKCFFLPLNLVSGLVNILNIRRWMGFWLWHSQRWKITFKKNLTATSWNSVPITMDKICFCRVYFISKKNSSSEIHESMFWWLSRGTGTLFLKRLLISKLNIKPKKKKNLSAAAKWKKMSLCQLGFICNFISHYYWCPMGRVYACLTHAAV